VRRHGQELVRGPLRLRLRPHAPWGAMPLEPAFWVYNTGGWLKNTKDRPPHTHLFGITAEGRVKMTRADFG